MRFPILTTDGKVYEIAGTPLVSEEKFKELYPELDKQLDIYEDEKIETSERSIAMVLAASLIIKIFNPAITIDDMLLDTYTVNKIMRIFNGVYDEDAERKKKEQRDISDGISEQE